MPPPAPAFTKFFSGDGFGRVKYGLTLTPKQAADLENEFQETVGKYQWIATRMFVILKEILGKMWRNSNPHPFAGGNVKLAQPPRRTVWRVPNKLGMKLP